MKQNQLAKLSERLATPKQSKGKPRILVSVWLRGIPGRDGKMAVYLRILGKHNWSTGVRTRKRDFDPANWTVNGDDAATSRLQILRAEFIKGEAQLFKLGEAVTPQSLLSIVLNDRGMNTVPCIKEAIEAIVKRYEDRYNADQITKHTVVAVRKFAIRLCEWLDEDQQPDLRFTDLKPDTANRFYLYWTIKRGKCVGYTRKMFHFLRQVVAYGVGNNWLNRDPFAGFKWHQSSVKSIVYLTEDELGLLLKHHFSNPTYELARDGFLLQCYTGLSYVDLRDLSESHLCSFDGIPSILIGRSKTQVTASLPLLPPAQASIDKYAPTPHRLRTGRLMPVLSNQKMNANLKAVAEIVGITKRLTTHMGRKTFATLVANLNVSEGTLAKSLGHRNTSVTRRHYAVQQAEATVKEIATKWRERSNLQKVS